MRVLNDICYNPSFPSDCLYDVYLPEGQAEHVLVYFHGGGLEAGDKRDAQCLAKTLVEHGVALVSTNYRMYPSAQYPQFVEDAACAVGYVKRHIAQYNARDSVLVGGSSAGGYLSMMLCFDPKYLKAQGVEPDAIAGYVHDAGQPTCHFNVLRERGVDKRRIIVDEAAPLYHVGLCDHYAAMLFIVSDQDMANRLEQTQLMISTLRHFGYDLNRIELQIMHGGHCHYVGQMEPNGESVLANKVIAFLQRTVA